MSARSVLLWIGVALAFAAQPALDAVAGNGSPANLPAFTPEREKTALEFVAAHHPELAQVLGKLEQADRPQYEQAIRELFDTRQRLSLHKDKDPELYGLLLEGWKTQSRAEMLAARIACADEKDPALEAELRALIAKKVDLERKTVEHNREKLLKTLEGMEKSLKWFDENRDSLIERRLKSLTNSGRKSGVKAQKNK